MLQLLKQKGFIYEENKTFKDISYPYYFYKIDNGFIVFVILSNEIGNIDFAIYDSQKKFISMIHQIDLIIKDIESQDMFISNAIYRPYNHDFRTKTR